MLANLELLYNSVADELANNKYCTLTRLDNVLAGSKPLLDPIHRKFQI